MMEAGMTGADTDPRARAATELDRARVRSLGLTDAADDELTHQHSPLMSPLVWDLAHIGNQEELWLVRDVGGRAPVREDIDHLYDAFQQPRRSRPQLPLLGPAEARRYIGTVRDKVFDLLDTVRLEGRPLVTDAFAFGMIVQHEQQHDETMLATHQLRSGAPLLSAPPPPAPSGEPAIAGSEAFVPAGPFTMGTSTEPWALDNERPAHRVDLPAFFIDRYPVTNGQFLAFIDAGGYANPAWWSATGWAHRQEAGLERPQHWHEDGTATRFGRREPIDPAEPVVHVGWFEAEAYARWAGKRLPSEAEWEKAARFDPATGRSRRYPWGDDDPTEERANLGQRHLSPAPIGAYPAGAAPSGVHQLIGDVWEWTSSDFHGYPGFAAFPYREYSEVFFGGDYKVLRGGSFGTDASACRGTFRNWDYPIRRQIFSGFRCARDAGGAGAEVR
jgi:gamma-glutamyl hercynylcysteine S-oxide synthase